MVAAAGVRPSGSSFSPATPAPPAPAEPPGAAPAPSRSSSSRYRLPGAGQGEGERVGVSAQGRLELCFRRHQDGALLAHPQRILQRTLHPSL